ncbi:hypothetical protein I350_06475 [Cryptococcus amylolentus CBS 6273]|uniref:ACB domain-containing protein n=1 Tax=Cryptococcus amylolentus CBS 6273 TaxID=1296118 RepID=A0A1E3JL96_9TREE|nr:hypothetical protein I350_06475 [Cryptococcus amylolentus CBS 6273]
MTDPTPREQFEAASPWLASAPAAAGLPNETKLELYGLFKFVTTNEGPSSPRPSIFYPANRAKFDAWTSTFKQYTSLNIEPADAQARAQGRYVDIAKQVGWDGVIRDEDDIDLENLSDSDDEEDESRKGGSGKDGWRSMSVMEGAGKKSAEDPIHDAVSTNDSVEVKRLLQNDKGLVNAVDEFGYTPLHLAADRGYPDMTRLLLEHGADRNVKDQDEQTPLMLAEISSRDDIIVILSS